MRLHAPLCGVRNDGVGERVISDLRVISFTEQGSKYAQVSSVTRVAYCVPYVESFFLIFSNRSFASAELIMLHSFSSFEHA